LRSQWFGRAPRRNTPTDGNDMYNEVSNNPAQHRFELEVDGHVAAAHYELSDGVITFEHTEVPTELGGKGVGSKLVKGALDQVRADGLVVVAQCPFVRSWIEKHPDYAGLLKP
jgi:predicted GNAT family acetyltransferase